MSLADIPPAELPFIPGMAPPNGTLSNFIDPPNRADVYIIVAAIFLSLATISVFLKLYVRLFVQRSPWWDDLALVFALLFQATYTGLNIWLCDHGVGKHMWDVRLIDLLPLINPARVMADITEPSLGFTKLALLLLYYRLFSPDPIVKLAIIAGIVFIVTVYTSLLFLFIFLSTAKTVPLNKTMAVLNVLTDAYIFVLPMYSVLKLYLPKRKKIGLAVVFASGAFAVAMSIVGAAFRFQFADNGADFTGGLLNVILVNQIEACVGIMCACMPLFPALLNKAHLISNDWIISMRSLRDRIFSGGNRSRGSQESNKSKDHDDFVQLNVPSGASSLKDMSKQHSSLKDLSRTQNSITEVHTDAPVAPRGANHGIEVTKNYTVGRD